MHLIKEYAMQLVGTPYRWGGDDPMAGFDCSGLVIELLQCHGVLPRNYDNSAQGLYNKFSKDGVFNSKGPGALVFFGKSKTRISHIGFMLDTFRMIEAGGGNSKTITKVAAATQNAYVRIRPITWRSDLVAIVKPRYNAVVK